MLGQKLPNTPNAKPSFSFGLPANAYPETPSKKCTERSSQTEDDLHVNKFMQGLKGLLQSGQYSDVTLNVKGRKFRGHKNILAAHSPVFTAMLEHDAKEKATGVVNIDDYDPKTFADFLHFMYSGSSQYLNSENMIDLYILADKYQVAELRKACTICMIKNMSLESFCDVMALSLRYHDKELSEVATKYFLENSIYIAKTAKWLTFMKENVVAGNELFLKVLELKKR